MELRGELIAELREKFFRKLDEETESEAKFHPADTARVRNSDDWLRRFLEHNEWNMQESLNMLWETCLWRKKFGTNDITENNVRRDYLQDGSCFSHGKDKDGKALFIIKSKLHVKGNKDFGELQRCIVYWFERLEREGNGDQISIFFDMAETGLSNMDMEFTKYLIGLFKSYYPYYLNYIIIFEMPWVLNAAFKVIKSWLPAKAIPKIKFANKTTLKEFVDPNNALKCWGGNDDYVFTFVSETQTNSDTAMNGKLDNKKVHFAESSPLTEQPPSNIGEPGNEEQLLFIEPDTITFNKEGNEITGTIMLKNITVDKSLSFKIKTTSPDKFRVRPSSGILLPSEQRNVTVVLQHGYIMRGLLHNDRFLVMCLPLKNANTSAQDLTTLWKNVKPAEQHRLRCCEGGTEKNETQKSALSAGVIGSESDIENIFFKINRLQDTCSNLQKQVASLKYLLLLSMMLTILLAVGIIYVLRSDPRSFVDQQDCHIPPHHGI